MQPQWRPNNNWTITGHSLGICLILRFSQTGQVVVTSKCKICKNIFPQAWFIFHCKMWNLQTRVANSHFRILFMTMSLFQCKLALTSQLLSGDFVKHLQNIWGSGGPRFKFIYWHQLDQPLIDGWMSVFHSRKMAGTGYPFSGCL